MPNLTQTKARAKALPAKRTTDWLGVWALSLAAGAIGAASIVYYLGADAFGASFTLAGTAAVIVTVLCVGGRRSGA
jgi:hypothetical protein